MFTIDKKLNVDMDVGVYKCGGGAISVCNSKSKIQHKYFIIDTQMTNSIYYYEYGYKREADFKAQILDHCSDVKFYIVRFHNIISFNFGPGYYEGKGLKPYIEVTKPIHSFETYLTYDIMHSFYQPDSVITYIFGSTLEIDTKDNPFEHVRELLKYACYGSKHGNNFSSFHYVYNGLNDINTLLSRTYYQPYECMNIYSLVTSAGPLKHIDFGDVCLAIGDVEHELPVIECEDVVIETITSYIEDCNAYEVHQLSNQQGNLVSCIKLFNSAAILRDVIAFNRNQIINEQTKIISQYKSYTEFKITPEHVSKFYTISRIYLLSKYKPEILALCNEWSQYGHILTQYCIDNSRKPLTVNQLHLATYVPDIDIYSYVDAVWPCIAVICNFICPSDSEREDRLALAIATYGYGEIKYGSRYVRFPKILANDDLKIQQLGVYRYCDYSKLLEEYKLDDNDHIIMLPLDYKNLTLSCMSDKIYRFAGEIDIQLPKFLILKLWSQLPQHLKDVCVYIAYYSICIDCNVYFELLLECNIKEINIQLNDVLKMSTITSHISTLIREVIAKIDNK